MYRKFGKRMIDIIGAFVMLVLSSPILLVAAICIKIHDGGNVVFKQKRIGKNENPFYIYKLRTMAKNEEGINTVTKLGGFLRATSIDELPQLLNILKGEMSFIGPRPWIEEYTKYFTKQDRRRSEVLPGLSGWAQVQGRNGITVKQKLNADTWYVDHVSMRTDINIFCKTILLVFQKTGASITEKGIQDELKELKENYQQRMISDVELTAKKDVG